MASPTPFWADLTEESGFEILRSTGDRLREVAAGRDGEALRRKPVPGKWSAYEIIGHLADCEMIFQTRLRMILFQDNPTLPAFEHEKWVAGWAKEQEPAEEVAARFAAMRRATVRLLESASDAELDRTGTHPVTGQVSARHFIRFVAGHDRKHLKQIAFCLA